MKKNLLSLLLLTFIAFSGAFAQSRKITGRVIGSDDGQTLPGVSVKVQGTSRGVQTDGDGTFVISAETGQVLTFTFVGYASHSVKIGANSNLGIIKLVSDSKILTEVVVADGYSIQSKKSFAGSATTINGTVNENKPFSNPIAALQGQVAGVNVSSNSGQPGANLQVRLRGVNSISLSSQPLYVIDGMIINSGDLSNITTSTNVLSGVNDNDIETITVLKDAAATAIYGSRGSNGVIVITTKRGKAGKTQVRADMEIGTTSNLPTPAAGRSLTGDEWAMLTSEGLANAGVSAASIASTMAGYGVGGPQYDWRSLVTRKGNQQQFNVSINGGGDNTRIFSSFGYYAQDATTIGSSLKRFSGLLNIDQNISKRFSVSFGLNISNTGQYTPSNGGAFASPVLAAYFLRPFQQPYNADGSLNFTRSGNTNFPDIFNPLFMVANDKKFDSETRGLVNTQIKWNIWDELKFTTFASIDYTDLEESQFNNPIMGDGRTSNGRAYDYYDRYFNYLFRNQLSYRYNIPATDNFYIDASVGYEAQRFQNYFIRTNSNGFPATQPLLTASVNASTPVLGNATFDNHSFASIYSLATINYKNLYTLSGTFRRDGSSVFGENLRYANFYSVGGTWNVDEENFFKSLKYFSSLKLRSSYGVTGNANGITSYQARQTAGYGINYAGLNGQNYNTVGNPNLTWESSNKFDIGLDMGFFKDRLMVNVDYYYNNIKSLIQDAPVSLTTGFGTIKENIGSMYNKGEELTIKGTPVQTKDLNWTVNFNIAFNNNRVTSLLNDLPIISGITRIAEGQDVQTVYTRQWAGVDPANGKGTWYADDSRTTTTYDNSTPSLRRDRYQLDPKYFGGLSNSVTYKGITLTADFYFNFGNMIRDGWNNYLIDGNNYTFNKYAYALNRWTTPGQQTDVPKYIAGGDPTNLINNFSTRFLYYDDYIRLRNLSIGYDVAKIGALKKLGISKLYIYGRGTNLWTKTYDSRLPFDPEVGPTGASNLEIPQYRTFTFGINLGL